MGIVGQDADRQRALVPDGGVLEELLLGWIVQGGQGSREVEIGGVTLEEVAYGWDDVRPLALFAKRDPR